MADPTPEERARDILLPDHGRYTNVRDAIATAIREAENATLLRAARWVRLGRWHDPDSCADGIAALKTEPPR